MVKKEKEIIETIIHESFDYGSKVYPNSWEGTTYYDNEGDVILKTRKDTTFIMAYHILIKQIKDDAYRLGERNCQSKIKNAFDFLFE